MPSGRRYLSSAFDHDVMVLFVAALVVWLGEQRIRLTRLSHKERMLKRNVFVADKQDRRSSMWTVVSGEGSERTLEPSWYYGSACLAAISFVA